jgi:hypothetical protein
MSFVDKFWTKTNELANSALAPLRMAIPGIGLGSDLSTATSSGISGGSTDPHLSNRKYTIRIIQDGTIVVGAVPETLEINQSAAWNAPWAGGISGAKGDIMALGLGTRLVAQVLTLQVWQGGGNNDFDFTVQFELRAYSDANRDVMIPLKALLSMTMPSLSSNGFLKAPGPQLSQKGLRDLGAGVAAVAVETGKVVVDAAKAGYSMASGAITGKGSMTNASISSLSEAGNNAVDRIGTASKNAGLTRRAIEANMENKIGIEIGDWFRMSNVVITDVRHTMRPQRPAQEDGMIMAADVVVSFRPMFTVTREDIDMILGSQLRAPGQRRGM